MLATLALPAVPAAADTPSLGQIVVSPGTPAWLSYHLLDSFFMAGPGDPEDFLYRGSRNPDGTRDGDQMALIEKLAPTGANSIYFAAVGSDSYDPTKNPFIDDDPDKGLNPNILDQWETWFAEMDRHGIVIFFIFYNDGIEVWPTGDVVGPEERAFLHGIVDRFEHHKHLIWVVAEEFEKVYTPVRVSAIAAEIRAADDHDHPVALHRLPNRDFAEFADDPNFDQFAVQTWGPDAGDYHGHLLNLWNEAAGRYNLDLAEGRIWGEGQVARRNAWASAMAGAYVMAFEMDIASTPMADLEDLGRLRRFMERTDFQAMEPRDDLADGDTAYVLARIGRSYIAYAPAGSGAIGLRDFVAGEYRLLWLDTATGQEVVQDNVSLTSGPQAWARPAGIGEETAVYALRLDGENDLPLAHDRAVSTFAGLPVEVFLAASDPDGPGPYTYSIVGPPAAGTLSGAPPDLTYTPDPGTLGNDSFTWIVNDGRDDSSPATMSIAVSQNQIPVARDAAFSTVLHPVSLSLADYVEDPDGPGPYTYTILIPPADGQLTGSGAEWTYTPDAGFVGTDSFTWQVHDGLDLSNAATVTVEVQETLFADNFERPDSDVVGNGWVEVEDLHPVVLSNGRLVFEARDEPYRPLVRHALPALTSGQVVWGFDLDFLRSGPEQNYAVRMQLGLGGQMSDDLPEEQGVAVNLIWGSLSSGLATHEGLGAVVDGMVTQITTVSGLQRVQVEIDLDARTYRVDLDGQTSAAFPFDENVPIDAVRFFTHGVHLNNFSSRQIDNVFVTGVPDAGGFNDPPLALDESVSTLETLPVDITLRFSDPDGPGPYTYSIVNPPVSGALFGTAPDLTYTPDPGFLGIDSFTWRVNDGEADSNVATVSIAVDPNQVPVALDAGISTPSNTPVAISLAPWVEDPDGPGPYTYAILSQPTSGQLTGGGSEWTYTPDSGFVGADAFTWQVHDGLADSNPATVTVQVEDALFSDGFERPDSGTVGNGWIELEGSGPLLISGGNLVFDPLDEPYRPLVRHDLPLRTSGQLVWSFDLDFARVGPEGSYSFWMQLGLGAQMSDEQPDEQGVAVNLYWGKVGRAPHEGLGYLVDGGYTYLATVSGRQPVRVEVDLDARTYRVEAAGELSGEILFDENVPIDTVRFFAHRLNRNNFSPRQIDNVLVTGPPDTGGVNDPPAAFDSSVSTLESLPVEVTLEYADPDGPGPFTFTIVGPPASGALSGTAPLLTYTPDPGFVGSDAFTWIVKDGEADSNLATVSITVDPNQLPVALDAEVATTSDTPLAISLATWVDDPDGPGPYTYSILSQPASGQLTGSGSEWTYTPDPGFVGMDSFVWQVHDGLADSNPATVTVRVEDALFADDFERPDSDLVGNGWVELEGSGPALIAAGNLVFDALDEPFQPQVSHALPARSSGRLVWSFDLDFARTGPEWNYAFRMQLGLAAQMSNGAPEEQGVAVNLIWGSLSAGLATHEGLGYVVDGAVAHLATVSGRQGVRVEVDLDARTYRVEVAGQSSADVPFDENVAIDAVRFFAHGLNRNNFSSRQIDNVLVAVP